MQCNYLVSKFKYIFLIRMTTKTELKLLVKYYIVQVSSFMYWRNVVFHALLKMGIVCCKISILTALFAGSDNKKKGVGLTKNLAKLEINTKAAEVVYELNNKKLKKIFSKKKFSSNFWLHRITQKNKISIDHKIAYIGLIFCAAGKFFKKQSKKKRFWPLFGNFGQKIVLFSARTAPSKLKYWRQRRL